MPHSFLDRLASLLVHYSARVGPNQIAGILAPVRAMPLVAPLHREVLRAGAYPVLCLSSARCQAQLIEYGSSGQLSFVDPLELRTLEISDTSIHVHAGEDFLPTKHVPEETCAILERTRQPLRDTLVRRMEQGVLRWVATLFPCRALACLARMSTIDYKCLLETACFLHHTDPVAVWRHQSELQARLMESLSRAKELRFRSPSGTDLRVGIESRSWLNGDGHDNMPDGEVFTGPIEDATEGVLCFNLPAVFGGHDFGKLRLSFRAGRVVDVSAEHDEDLLHRVLDSDAGARVLGEVALGCNHEITHYTRDPLIDEKVAGTFHVALGTSYPKSGGRNQSALHWDLVHDLRQGGEVWLDGELISKDGRFLNSRWPQPTDGKLKSLRVPPRAQDR